MTKTLLTSDGELAVPYPPEWTDKSIFSVLPQLYLIDSENLNIIIGKKKTAARRDLEDSDKYYLVGSILALTLAGIVGSYLLNPDPIIFFTSLPIRGGVAFLFSVLLTTILSTDKAPRESKQDRIWRLCEQGAIVVKGKVITSSWRTVANEIAYQFTTPTGLIKLGSERIINGKKRVKRRTPVAVLYLSDERYELL